MFEFSLLLMVLVSLPVDSSSLSVLMLLETISLGKIPGSPTVGVVVVVVVVIDLAATLILIYFIHNRFVIMFYI